MDFSTRKQTEVDGQRHPSPKELRGREREGWRGGGGGGGHAQLHNEGLSCVLSQTQTMYTCMLNKISSEPSICNSMF